MVALNRNIPGIPLTPGKEIQVFDGTVTGPETETARFRIDSDTLLVSVQAPAVSGTLDVNVYTETPDGQSTQIINFPVISAATTELLMRKAPTAMAPIRIEVTYSGTCTFTVRARASNLGEASFKISGSTAGDNFSTEITSTASLIVPVSLEDRNGMSIVNNDTSAILYVGFNALVTVGPGPNAGTPVKPGGSFGLDIAAGLTLYGISDSTPIDVRVMEVG